MGAGHLVTAARSLADAATQRSPGGGWRPPAGCVSFSTAAPASASAVEEFLRYDSAVASFARTAKEDIQLSGGVVPKGEVVVAVLPSANHDPAVFADPERLDVGRGDTRHLGFGGGMHTCIGAALARMETRIAMTSLLARYPRMELAASELNHMVSWVVRGVTSLPVNVG